MIGVLRRNQITKKPMIFSKWRARFMVGYHTEGDGGVFGERREKEKRNGGETAS